jgi:hypothetical protein
MGNILFHLYEPFISIWALPSHIVATNLAETLVGYWVITLHCLIIAGTNFCRCFKVLDLTQLYVPHCTRLAVAHRHTEVSSKYEDIRGKPLPSIMR